MTEKQLCSDCKHLEHDGMAGIWCGVRGNNKNYDCPKFEYNWGRLTKEEAINHLNRLYYENKQLKQAISDWKGSYDELYENCEKLEEENEQLKNSNHTLAQNLIKNMDIIVKLERENEWLRALIKKTLETTPIKHTLTVELKNSVRELYD